MLTFCPSCRHCASAALAMLSAASVESVASFTTFCAAAGTAQPISINRDSPCFPKIGTVPVFPLALRIIACLRLLELGAAFLHHLRPLSEVGGHEIAELARRVADRLG